MTTFKSIQIKNQNIQLMQKILSPIKAQCMEKIACKQRHIEQKTPTFSIYEPEPIKLLALASLDYVTLIADDLIMSPELAQNLSKELQAICIFSEYYDDEYYQILIFYGGIQKFSLLKYAEGEEKKLNIGILYDAVQFTKKQCEYFENALKLDVLFDSFVEMEKVFNAHMAIDFNHTSLQMIKEYEEYGVKWYFV